MVSCEGSSWRSGQLGPAEEGITEELCRGRTPEVDVGSPDESTAGGCAVHAQSETIQDFQRLDPTGLKANWKH